MPTCVWRRACGVESTGWGNWPSVTEPSRRSTIATVMQPEVTYQPFTLLHNNFIIIIIIMAIVYAQFKLFAPHQVTSEMNNNFYVFLFFFCFFFKQVCCHRPRGSSGHIYDRRLKQLPTIGWRSFPSVSTSSIPGEQQSKKNAFVFVCLLFPASICSKGISDGIAEADGISIPASVANSMRMADSMPNLLMY